MNGRLVRVVEIPREWVREDEGMRRRLRQGLFWAGFAAAVAGIAWAASQNWRNPLAAATAAYLQGDYNAAARLSRAVLKESPGDNDARRLLARSAARLGRREQAQQLFAPIDRQQLQAEDLALIGRSLMEQGQIAPAMKLFREALDESPRQPDALHGLAWLCAGTDRLAEATALAQKLAAQPGWEARGNVIAGLAADDAHDPRAAVDYLSRALDLDPDLRGVVGSPGPIRLRLARDFLRLQRPDDALRQLAEVGAAASFPEVAWLESRAELQKGDRLAYESAMAAAFGYDPGPLSPEPAAYTGSARCAECHAEIARSQRGTRHAKTFAPASDRSDLKLPDHSLIDPDNSRGHIESNAKAGSSFKRPAPPTPRCAPG